MEVARSFGMVDATPWFLGLEPDACRRNQQAFLQKVNLLTEKERKEKIFERMTGKEMFWKL